MYAYAYLLYVYVYANVYEDFYVYNVGGCTYTLRQK